MSDTQINTNCLDLSMTQDQRARVVAGEIAALPYVRQTILLPDLHFKSYMEAPSSFVTATEGVIVPHLASAAINCGMGLVRTDIDADQVAPEQLEAIAVAINREAAPNKFSTTKYSWSVEQHSKAMRCGAEPLLKDYGLDPSFVEAFEDRGRATPEPLKEEDIRRCVPRFLRKNKFARSEIGINFGGNHFLEAQVVDRVVDSEQAARFGLEAGKLAIMYHLGPGPLGGNLANLYAYRIKPSRRRRMGYAVFRYLYQASKGRARRKTFGGLSRWLAIPDESPEGEVLGNVMHVVKNYGYAYRAGTVRAIMDALAEVFGDGASRARLVVDVSHNMLQPEQHDGRRFWVCRHNVCRPIENFPGIVAGNSQVPSCICVGMPECENQVSGYDHGAGTLLKAATGQLAEDPRGLQTQLIEVPRGGRQVVGRRPMPVLRADMVEDVMATLEKAEFVRPVAYMRPMMTLKDPGSA